MNSVFILQVCITIFIFQIVVLVNAIKKMQKKYWVIAFCLDFYPIIILKILEYGYYHLASNDDAIRGLIYLGTSLICNGACIIYFVILCITIIACIITLRKKQKDKIEKPDLRNIP